MEKRDRGIAKWICFILAGLAGVVFLFSVVCASYFEEEDFYTVSKEEKIEELYNNFSNRYSAYVMENIGTGRNQEYFSDKNFRYGVVQTDSIEELKKLDLNRKSSFVETNFDKNDISLNDLHVFECNLSNNTTFYSKKFESINGHIYISDSRDNSATYYEITNYVYDKENGFFYAYVRDNNTYYRIEYLTLVVNYQAHNEDGITAESTEKSFAYNELSGKYQPTNSAFDQSQVIISFPQIDLGNAYSVEQIEEVKALLSNVEFTFNLLDDTWLGYENWIRYGVEYQFVTYESIDQESILRTSSEGEMINARFAIGSLPEENACRIKGMQDCHWSPEKNLIVDMNERDALDNRKHYFVLSYIREPLETNGNWKKSDLYVKAYYFLDRVYRFCGINVFIVMGISFFTGLFASIYVLVAAKKKHWINRIPLEILWLVSGLLFLGILAVFIGGIDTIDEFTDYLWILIIFMSVFLDILIAFGVLIDFVIRVKAGEWWKTTICYYVYRLFITKVNKLTALFVSGNHLAIKFIGVYGAVAVVETVLVQWLTNSLDGGQILVWIAWKAVVGVFALKWLMKWKETKDSEIQEAVAEKVKSERFQTELITNVSHDIKTPLTSVINYVDLLKKEDIQNEQALSYIEVLDRQSVRLKKLIEDLIEASKASTGNLSVKLEKLDAKVFLIQTIGEFQEKINALGLEMVINKPEEEVMIQADGRHLWRVIDNLMNNICKYAQPSTRVYIDLVQEDENVKIIFKNTSKTALNITSEELMRRFVRGDTSRNTEGSGLGLSIAQNLMELMGGKLQLVVDGDLFKVTLVFPKAILG